MGSRSRSSSILCFCLSRPSSTQLLSSLFPSSHLNNFALKFYLFHQNFQIFLHLQRRVFSSAIPRQMSGRTFVVIVVFWAFLTIITPTLVLLSETSKHALDVNGEGTKTRRMMGYKMKLPITTPTAHPAPTEAPAPAPAPSPSPSPSPAPAPKPTPNRAVWSRKAYIGKLFSESMRAVIKKRLMLRLI